jgi:hypothetical protein
MFDPSATSSRSFPASTPVSNDGVDNPQSLTGPLYNHNEAVVKGPPLVLEICRNELFSQSVAFYKSKTSGQLSQPFHVKFEGEAGIDAGGVRREFFNSFFNLLLIQGEVCLRGS